MTRLKSNDNAVKSFVRMRFPVICHKLAEWRWGIQYWIIEHLRSQGAEKKAEWRIRRIAQGIRNLPVDSSKAKVLFFTVEGWPYHLLCQAFFAIRLRQLGHAVKFLMCDGGLPFCNMTNCHNTVEGHVDCSYCRNKKEVYLSSYFESLSLGAPSVECHKAMDAIDNCDLEECQLFEYMGLPLGMLCKPTLMWFQCRAFLSDNDVSLYRKLLKAGTIIAEQFSSQLEEQHPDVVVIFNGDFFAERIARVLCESRNVRYVCHELGYLPDTLFVARNMPAAGGSVDDTYAKITMRPVSVCQRKKVQHFFKMRQRGPIGIGGKVFWPTIERDPELIKKDLNLDDRPIAVLFTNVTWDTAALGRDVIFEGLFDWAVQVIQFFGNHPEWQLVVRCHPSEIRDKGRESRDRLEVMLSSEISTIPPNVTIVSAASVISSYVLMDMAETGLVYTSTVGMEMVAAGKPVITAGRSHYRGKGFTCDPENREQYFDEICRYMMKREEVSSPQQEALYKYAYHFFFERMIFFEPVHLEPGSSIGAVQNRSAASLSHGKCKGLDTICNCIAEDSEPVIKLRE